MKKYDISHIQGGEILAQPVMTSNYQVLLSSGITLRKEYVEKLKELNISTVYVEDEDENQEEYCAVRDQLQVGFKSKVKDILERHIYCDNQELKELSKTADIIINNILQEENIIEEVIEIKERNADLYEHSVSCCVFSTILGLRLGLQHEEVHSIGVGCLLHDIGLRYLPKEFINIDLEELGENEIEEYKKHPIYGYSSIKEENWLSEISKNIILFHHERMDGTGYPLHTKQIPQEARIAGICDVIDELICGVGCKQHKIYEAVEYLKTFKNEKFDGKIVDEFLKIMAVYPKGTYVLTNEGDTCIVSRQNKEFPERPILRVIKDKQGIEVNEEVIIDLLKNNNLFIESVLN